jgi:hypothetical protein
MGLGVGLDMSSHDWSSAYDDEQRLEVYETLEDLKEQIPEELYEAIAQYLRRGDIERRRLPKTISFASVCFVRDVRSSILLLTMNRHSVLLLGLNEERPVDGLCPHPRPGLGNPGLERYRCGILHPRTENFPQPCSELRS